MYGCMSISLKELHYVKNSLSEYNEMRHAPHRVDIKFAEFYEFLFI